MQIQIPPASIWPYVYSDTLERYHRHTNPRIRKAASATAHVLFPSQVLLLHQRSYRARREKFSDFSPHSHHCKPFPGLALYCRGSDFVHEFSTVLLRRFFFLEFQAFTQEDDGTFGWNVRFVPATPHSRGLGRTGRARLCLCDEAIFAVRSEGKNGRIGFSYPSRRRRRLRLVGTL